MPFFGPPDVEKLKAKGDVKGLVKALGYQKDPAVAQRAFEAIVFALRSPDSNVRNAAQIALKDLGNRGKRGNFIEALTRELLAIGPKYKIPSDTMSGYLYRDKKGRLIQDPRTREIGELYDIMGDIETMRTMYELVSSQLGRAYAAELDVAWDGIGEWKSSPPKPDLTAPATGQLKGVLTNEATGRPVMAALLLTPVKAERDSFGKTVIRVPLVGREEVELPGHSDSSGAFIFRDVVPGQYQLYTKDDASGKLTTILDEHNESVFSVKAGQMVDLRCKVPMKK